MCSGGKIKKNNKTLTFKAYSHPYFKKGFWWYLAVVLVCLIILGAFVYFELYLGALALAVATAVWLVYSRMPQKEISCTISVEGVKFGDRFYPKKHLKSFSVVGASRQNILYLETNILLRPIAHIFLGEQSIYSVRKILTGYLPEKKKKEDFSDKLTRWLKI